MDAVSLCLPHQLHAPAAIAAAEARKHNLVEKPIATSLDEADAMIAAADRAGVTLMVAENVRCNRLYLELVEIIKGGQLGDLSLIRIAREHQMHDYLRRRPWFLSDPFAGIMVSGGIHDCELLRMLGGEIEHVYGLIGPKALAEMQADENSVVVVRLASGAKALIVESFSMRTPTPGVNAVIQGSLGSLWFSGDRCVRYTSTRKTGMNRRRCRLRSSQATPSWQRSDTFWIALHSTGTSSPAPAKSVNHCLRSLRLTCPSGAVNV